MSLPQSQPAPLTPADCDLRSFCEMSVDVALLRDSNMASFDDAEVFRAAVLLWCASWHQVPAASLPNNDKELARLTNFGRDVEAFRAIKEGALHKFVLCSDGRLYHPVVAKFALKAWEIKKKRVESGRAGGLANRRKAKRSSHAGANAQHRTEQSRTEKGKAPNGASPPASGTRLSPSWFADEVDRAYAAEKGLSPEEMGAQEDAFRDYWIARTGQIARKLDWHATWRTWVRRYLEDRGGGGKSGTGGGRGRDDPARRGGMLGAVMEARRARR